MYRKLSLLSLAFVGLVALGFVLVGQPESAEAGQCLPCSSGSPTETPVVTKTTVDCEWSVMEATAELNSMVSCPSGFCVKQFITTEACHEVGYQQWRVGMKLRYQCKECVESPGM